MAQTVAVREVMMADFLGVSEGDTVSEVVAVLREQQHDTAVVIRGGSPIGIATALDLLGVIDGGDRDDPIERYMHIPISTIDPDATLAHATNRLLTTETERLVVTDLEGTAVGLVTPRELLAAADTYFEDHLQVAIPASGERSPPSMSDQGVCESCGRLSHSLQESDGMMLCEACSSL